MAKSKLTTVKNKIKDGMLIGSIYDNVIKKTRYNIGRLPKLYTVLTDQKHKMLYYKKLRKKYFDKCTKNREWENIEKNINNDTVYFMWFQGIDGAPQIVKKCYEQLKEKLPNKKIILLSEENVFDYITLPDYIMEKYKKGIISPAHFSDLIRLELLIKTGGYWVDATVLVTDTRTFDFCDKIPLFMFSYYCFGFNAEILQLNNWFIKSNSNNNILCLVRKFLYEYWKDYDRAVHYFIFQIFVTIACEYYEKEFKDMPIVSQVDAHLLATYIFDEFSQIKWDVVKSSTGIHKLSTRFDMTKNKENSFYDTIIKQ